ncbi:MAG: hypothetical protein ABI181_05115 [Mycobacteriaceae bacterium]
MSADDARSVSAGPAEPEPRPSRLSGIAAPAAAWAFAFLILRVFAVSGYDWNTTFLVTTTLSVDDGLALLFGSLMAGHVLVALALMIVLPLLGAAFLWGERGHRPVVVLPATVGVVMIVALTLSFHSWWLPPVTAALFGVVAVLRRLPERRVRRVVSIVTARVGWVAGVAVLLVAALVGTPWVPREEITMVGGQVIDGYVLSVDSGYLNVLTSDHEFVILISADVVART